MTPHSRSSVGKGQYEGKKYIFNTEMKSTELSTGHRQGMRQSYDVGSTGLRRRRKRGQSGYKG